MNFFLRNIRLLNFKNYVDQSVECGPGIHCLAGKNGMGKTNFLDAIYYLCMTKSHFGLTDNHLIRRDAEFFRLEGLFEVDRQSNHIIAKVQSRKKKVFERNKVPYDRLSEHIGLLPVVIITPDDTQLATEGSEIRRRFLDNTLSQLDVTYLSHLITYHKVLKQRNALLKKMADSESFNSTLLEVYDQQLLGPAAYIVKKRLAFLEEFHPVFQSLHQQITKAQEQVQLSYRSALLETPFDELLRINRDKDRILQRTTKGIHRDDLHFELENQALKRFASQGQLKSFILALKLTQFHVLRNEKHYSPILLLDDLFDKLDQQRVRQLIELLLDGTYGQIFITDTHPNRVATIVNSFGIDCTQWLVEDGRFLQ